MSTAPRAEVSVIIPLFNGAAYIEETLTSVQRQTMTDIEVLVVDDGSSDDGAAIAAAHPLRPRVLSQDNAGVAVARNHGLAEARGQWVTFVDQDDLWHPTRLERLTTWLDEHADEQLVTTTEVAFSTEDEMPMLSSNFELQSTWASHIVSRANALDDLCRTVDVSGTSKVERFGHRELLLGPITVTTSFIARPALLRHAGGFAPHAIAMDDYWLLVNASRLRPAVKVDQPTAFYRVHLGATSRSTKLALPFLSSAVALRLGGALVPPYGARENAPTGPLHEHLLDELLRSDEYASSALVRSEAKHLSALLWPDGRTKELVKARARHELGWALPIIRSARSRVRAAGRRTARHADER